MWHKVGAWRSAFLCAAVLSITGTPGSSLATTVGCSPTQMKIVASTVKLDGGTSTNFKNVRQGAVSFTQGGKKSSCVVVHFSASTYAGNADVVVIRPLLDGADLAVPPELQFSGFENTEGGGGAAAAHAFDFLFPSVKPGSHTIQMQFRTSAGNLVFVHEHTTIVQYAP